MTLIVQSIMKILSLKSNQRQDYANVCSNAMASNLKSILKGGYEFFFVPNQNIVCICLGWGKNYVIFNIAQWNVIVIQKVYLH